MASPVADAMVNVFNPAAGEEVSVVSTDTFASSHVLIIKYLQLMNSMLWSSVAPVGACTSAMHIPMQMQLMTATVSHCWLLSVLSLNSNRYIPLPLTLQRSIW